MTLLAVVLVATCLLAGLSSTWSEHRARRRKAPYVERRHVRIVKAPYDWKEHDA